MHVHNVEWANWIISISISLDIYHFYVLGTFESFFSSYFEIWNELLQIIVTSGHWRTLGFTPLLWLHVGDHYLTSLYHSSCLPFLVLITSFCCEINFLSLSMMISRFIHVWLMAGFSSLYRLSNILLCTYHVIFFYVLVDESLGGFPVFVSMNHALNSGVQM